MKNTAYRTHITTPRARIPYPNSATRKEMLHKVLDLLICSVIGAGLAASLLLLAVIL